MKYIFSIFIIIISIFLSAGIKLDYENINTINDSILNNTELIFNKNGLRFTEGKISIIINNEKNRIFIINNEEKTYQVLPIEELQNLMKMFYQMQDTSKIKIKEIRKINNIIFYAIYKNNEKILEIENNESIDMKQYDKSIKLLKNTLKTMQEITFNGLDLLIDRGIPQKIIYYENNEKSLITKLNKLKKGDFSSYMLPPKNYNEE